MAVDMPKIALVTGANRGIGWEICKQLADLGVRVLLTSRDEERGRQALRELQDGKRDLSYCPLDVSAADSVLAARAFVEREFGTLHILINNAAIYPDEGVSVLDVGIDTVRETFDINFYGPLMMCQAFVPLMRKQNYGRVVNVSSDMGSLEEMEGYTAAYRMSKTALNALTRVLAAEVRRSNIKVNAMCPGWVRTEMGGANAEFSPAEGADTAIWLAMLPDDGPTNGFFQRRRPIAW
jgi:NAD(P)-dependent dehydrogenase (short-subunit alcohol dehydrogenase family)